MKEFNIRAALKGLSRYDDSLSDSELLAGRQKLLSALRGETQELYERYIRAERRQRLMKYVISVLLGLSLVGGTAFASGNAKPGDILYPVKRATESVQLAITADPQAKADLQAKFAQERLNEVAQLSVQAGLTASSSASSTAAAAASSSEGSELEIKARQDADVQVSNAVSALQKVQADLEAKGNAAAAAAIGDDIIKLQTHAHNVLHINLGDEAGSRPAATGTPAQEDRGAQGFHHESNEVLPVIPPLLQNKVQSTTTASTTLHTHYQIKDVHGDDEGGPQDQSDDDSAHLQIDIHNSLNGMLGR